MSGIRKEAHITHEVTAYLSEKFTGLGESSITILPTGMHNLSLMMEIGHYASCGTDPFDYDYVVNERLASWDVSETDDFRYEPQIRAMKAFIEDCYNGKKEDETWSYSTSWSRRGRPRRRPQRVSLKTLLKCKECKIKAGEIDIKLFEYGPCNSKRPMA